MSGEPIFLVGAGGHARACIDVIEQEERFVVTGLIGQAHEVGTTVLGYPVLGTDADIPALCREYANALVAVGQIKTPEPRMRLFATLEQHHARLPVIVSPRAYVSRHATVGAGSIVMHGAVVNAGATVGRNCIINTLALVEHDATISDHCHISTSSAVNSGVRVGAGTFIGSGSSVRQGLNIGERCVVGMGQRVLTDCESGTRVPSRRQEAILKTLIIAEAGVNHNGDMDLARRLVDAAAAAGADMVKFQTFNADRLTTSSAGKADYQAAATGAEESQQAMLRRLELSRDMHQSLIAHCRARGIRFFSTAFDQDSVRMLADLGLDRFKVPSGEITNLPYLRLVGGYRKPVILSTGMAGLDELDAALKVLQQAGTPRDRITVLHCTTEYPAPMADVNLRAMQTIKDRFAVAVGYSDHTAGIEVAIAAVAMGASVIEKHLTIDRNLPGPDHKASLEPGEFAAMVAAIRNVEQALGDGIKQPCAGESRNAAVVRKSLVAACPIKAGEPFTESNLTVKRPGHGISPMRWDEVIGKPAPRAFAADEIIEL